MCWQHDGDNGCFTSLMLVPSLSVCCLYVDGYDGYLYGTIYVEEMSRFIIIKMTFLYMHEGMLDTLFKGKDKCRRCKLT